MTFRFLLAIATVAIISLGAARSPEQIIAGSMPIAGPTSQPIGHFDFCKRYASECRPGPKDQGPIKLTTVKREALTEINMRVNTIPAKNDIEIYGVEEFWNFPTDAADCEDFALQKRRLLMQRGLSPSNLLITVVLQPDGSGHAVLTVRTNIGDLILDNLRPEIRRWSETEYTYLKRQDSSHPGKWVKIEDSRDAVAVAGIRQK